VIGIAKDTEWCEGTVQSLDSRLWTGLEIGQGHIELPKAVREHATSCSARTDGIVLSVTKNNVSSEAREIACTA